MVAACEAKAKQEGCKMNIAIVDDGANLIAFGAMDGADLVIPFTPAQSPA
jgi:uncharacterized protein GlcG (DUF336 family)